jgi:hypothetical protein
MFYIVTLIFYESSIDLNVESFIERNGLNQFQYYECIVKNNNGVGRVFVACSDNYRITTCPYYTLNGLQLISSHMLNCDLMDINVNRYCNNLIGLARVRTDDVVGFLNVSQYIQHRIGYYEKLIQPLIENLKRDRIRYLTKGEGSLEVSRCQLEVDEYLQEIERLKMVKN